MLETERSWEEESEYVKTNKKAEERRTNQMKTAGERKGRIY